MIRVYIVSKTAQVELKSGRVEAPAPSAVSQCTAGSTHAVMPFSFRRLTTIGSTAVVWLSLGFLMISALRGAWCQENCEYGMPCCRLRMARSGGSCTSHQRLTLLHSSAQRKPFLTVNTSPERLKKPQPPSLALPQHPLNTPCPTKSASVELTGLKAEVGGVEAFRGCVECQKWQRLRLS